MTTVKSWSVALLYRDSHLHWNSSQTSHQYSKFPKADGFHHGAFTNNISKHLLKHTWSKGNFVVVLMIFSKPLHPTQKKQILNWWNSKCCLRQSNAVDSTRQRTFPNAWSLYPAILSRTRSTAPPVGSDPKRSASSPSYSPMFIARPETVVFPAPFQLDF